MSVEHRSSRNPRLVIVRRGGPILHRAAFRSPYVLEKIPGVQRSFSTWPCSSHGGQAGHGLTGQTGSLSLTSLYHGDTAIGPQRILSAFRMMVGAHSCPSVSVKLGASDSGECRLPCPMCFASC